MFAMSCAMRINWASESEEQRCNAIILNDKISLMRRLYCNDDRCSKPAYLICSQSDYYELRVVVSMTSADNGHDRDMGS